MPLLVDKSSYVSSSNGSSSLCNMKLQRVQDRYKVGDLQDRYTVGVPGSFISNRLMTQEVCNRISSAGCLMYVPR